jgi:hypothetical protein
MPSPVALRIADFVRVKAMPSCSEGALSSLPHEGARWCCCTCRILTTSRASWLSEPKSCIQVLSDKKTSCSPTFGSNDGRITQHTHTTHSRIGHVVGRYQLCWGVWMTPAVGSLRAVVVEADLHNHKVTVRTWGSKIVVIIGWHCYGSTNRSTLL